VGKGLSDIMYYIVMFMQITEEQCQKWTENPNAYIEDEDDDSFSFTVRVHSQDLLVVSGGDDTLAGSSLA